MVRIIYDYVVHVYEKRIVCYLNEGLIINQSKNFLVENGIPVCAQSLFSELLSVLLQSSPQNHREGLAI